MSPSTAERFFRSAGAAAFSQFWRVGVLFFARFLLRRWIPPGDWGLWDWTLTVFLVLGAVRDLGLVYHVVRIDPRPYGNLLLVELCWGGLLVLAAFGGAPLLALAYLEPNPEIVPVVRALTLFLFFEGLAAVPKTYFESELQVGKAVLPELLRNLVFVSASMTLAFRGSGVWSLVIGYVLAAAVYAAHLWLKAWGKMPLHFERGRTLELVRQSLPLALIWFLLILVQNVDPLILGARFLGDVVGSYKFAYETAFLASLILVPAVTRALYPALVALRSEPRQLFEAYRLATLFVLAIEAPVALFLFANAETVIRILGGEQWVDSSPVFLRILCFAPLVDPISRLGGELLKALHQDRLWIGSALLTLTAFAGGGVLLTGRIGPVGMAWANFLPLGGLLMAWGVHRISPRGLRALLGDIGLIYLVPSLTFLALYGVVREDLLLRFGLSLVVLAAVFAYLARRFGKAFVAFFRDPVAATEDSAAAG